MPDTLSFYRACEKANPHSQTTSIVTRKENHIPQCNRWFYGVSVVGGLIFWYCS